MNISESNHEYIRKALVKMREQTQINVFLWIARVANLIALIFQVGYFFFLHDNILVRIAIAFWLIAILFYFLDYYRKKKYARR